MSRLELSHWMVLIPGTQKRIPEPYGSGIFKCVLFAAQTAFVSSSQEHSWAVLGWRCSFRCAQDFWFCLQLPVGLHCPDFSDSLVYRSNDFLGTL